MMSAERGASRHTIDAYRRDLAEYLKFLAQAGTSARSASAETVRSFLASLAHRELARSSAARKLSAVKQFHRFLHLESLAKGDPVAAVEGPKLGRPLPKIMSVKEVDRLLAAAKQAADTAARERKIRAVRLYCLIEVLYATGMRVSELLALPVSAAVSREQVLLVKGKGGRERLVPLNEAARKALQEYLTLRGGAAAGEGAAYLFSSHGEAGHLTRQHFGKELKALAAAAGSTTLMAP